MNRFLTGMTLLGLVAGGAIAQAQTAAEQVALPQNILVLDPAMRPLVIELLAVSPTFRRQCDTIGRSPNVSVTIGTVLSPVFSYRRSRLNLRRYDTGMIAYIEFPPLARAEVLAHDFEQILEQMEHVYQRGTLAPETRRADAAERAARVELTKADPVSRALARGIR